MRDVRPNLSKSRDQLSYGGVWDFIDVVNKPMIMHERRCWLMQSDRLSVGVRTEARDMTKQLIGPELVVYRSS